jgi:hypothetical protein
VSEITEALNLAATTANVVGDVWRERLAAMTAERDALKAELFTFKEENAYLLGKLSPMGRDFDPVAERDAAYDLGFRDGQQQTAARCAEIAEEDRTMRCDCGDDYECGHCATLDNIAGAIRKEFDLKENK